MIAPVRYILLPRILINFIQHADRKPTIDLEGFKCTVSRQTGTGFWSPLVKILALETYLYRDVECVIVMIPSRSGFFPSTTSKYE